MSGAELRVAAWPEGRVREDAAGRTRLRRAALAGVLLLAFALRLYCVLQPRIAWGDEPFYLWLGQSLLDGRGYQFFGISGIHFSPLFPLLAGIISRAALLFGVTGPAALMTGSAALYVVCGSALVLPVYAMARRLSGIEAGLMAALMAAAYPALTAGIPLWGTMTEPLYLLLVAAAWWAFLVAQQDGARWAYPLAGGLLGLAYLARTEALVYIVAGLGAIMLLECFVPTDAARRGARVRAALAGSGWALLVFCIVISPYLLALHGETGQWQLTEEAGSTYVSAQGLAYGDVAAFDAATWGLDPASGEVYLFSPTSEGQGLVSAILADPRGFLRLLRANWTDFVQTLISSRLIYWPLLSLILLGLFARPWDTRRLRGELLLAASLAGPLSFLPFFIQDRYIAGALIPALVWMGAGAAWLADWLSASWRAIRLGEESTGVPPTASPVAGMVVAGLLVAGLALAGSRLHGTLLNSRSFQPAHLSAAEELASRGVSATTVVMSRYPAIAFHAGAAWAPTPAAPWEDVLAYARGKGARYLAFDDWEATLRPQLAFLLDPAATPGGLRYLATVHSGNGAVVLYEIE